MTRRRRRTFSEWQNDVAQAYEEESCPNCGNNHGTVGVTKDGAVSIYCPLNGRTYWLATEPVPKRFAPEVLVQGDLPF